MPRSVREPARGAEPEPQANGRHVRARFGLSMALRISKLIGDGFGANGHSPEDSRRVVVDLATGPPFAPRIGSLGRAHPLDQARRAFAGEDSADAGPRRQLEPVG